MATATTRNTPIVMRYARALLQLANHTQQAEQMRAELEAVGQVLDANPTFGKMLADPGVSEAKRDTLIERAFRDRASPTMLNFLRLLNSKGRIALLEEIITGYDELLEEQLGNIDVDVTVAQPLTNDQLEQVRQKVSKSLGRNAVINQKVDPSIIGGLVLRVQDKLIDSSVRHQLEMMRRQLLAATPK